MSQNQTPPPLSEMEAVVSLLDEAHDEKVRALWTELETAFGLQGIYAAPYPHFSYHGAQDYPDDQVMALLHRVAAVTQPFEVQTSGLGVFSGPKPVLYLPVVRNPALEACHQRLYPTLSRLAKDENQHYHPDRWQPHITIAYGDLDHELLPDVMRMLSERSFAWELPITTLALVYMAGQDQGVKGHVTLGAASEEAKAVT